MKVITLLFPSVEKLIRFKLAIDPTVFELNLIAKTLFCSCNEEQIELAAYVYGARIFDMQPSLN